MLMAVREGLTARSRGLCASILALMAAAALALHVHAHDGDPKGGYSEPPVYAPVWREGDGGIAEQFSSSGVQLKSWFPLNTLSTSGALATSGNDCWGYVSPSGREYAIIGLNTGTAFVEITSPVNATLVAFRQRPANATDSLWRNVKTYRTWCYAVSEGGGGIQVFDLANIDNGVVTELPQVMDGGVASTHTMIINEQSGYLYRMGGGSGVGIRIYALEPNPASPAYVGQWADRYVHDGAVFTYTEGPYAGKEIFFACGGLGTGFTQTGMDIIDVTNKSALQNISRFTYPQAGYCHQVWLTNDRRYAYINDETDESGFQIYGRTRIVDVSNLSAPTLVGTADPGVVSVDHNLYVRDGLMFCANYQSGLRIFDVATNPAVPVPVAFFDTHPEADAANYAGIWTSYPYFPSGTVIGADMSRGLFVWTLGPAPATVSYPSGRPERVAPVGGGFDVSVTLAPGASLAPGSPALVFDRGQGTESTPLIPMSGTVYRAQFPPLACPSLVSYGIEVRFADGDVVRDPNAGLVQVPVGFGETRIYEDDFESVRGWTGGLTSDSASSGRWVRADPVGTVAQPEDDVTAQGTICWVTGNAAPGAAAGTADVDGGTTTLLSPRIDMSGLPNPILVYWRWYSNNLGSNPNNDSMPVQISNDDGLTWTQLELVTENQGQWVERRFPVSQFVLPTANMRLRFLARDLGTSSLVEAAVDDVRVIVEECDASSPADLNGDGRVNGLDLTILLGQWGTGGSADIDGDGAVSATDLTALLAQWSP
ncbi:MAG: choice-of-anchor B family protein [Phycisphaerales bacterium]|nr:choice-of-anchor B family protein [Phycisphaerales bacterium]